MYILRQKRQSILLMMLWLMLSLGFGYCAARKYEEETFGGYFVTLIFHSSFCFTRSVEEVSLLPSP